MSVRWPGYLVSTGGVDGVDGEPTYFLVACDCYFAPEFSDWRGRDGNDPSGNIAKDAAQRF
jgi:hypothetical protein